MQLYSKWVHFVSIQSDLNDLLCEFPTQTSSQALLQHEAAWQSMKGEEKVMSIVLVSLIHICHSNDKNVPQNLFYSTRDSSQ